MDSVKKPPMYRPSSSILWSLQRVVVDAPVCDVDIEAIALRIPRVKILVLSRLASASSAPRSAEDSFEGLTPAQNMRNLLKLHLAELLCQIQPGNLELLCLKETLFKVHVNDVGFLADSENNRWTESAASQVMINPTPYGVSGAASPISSDLITPHSGRLCDNIPQSAFQADALSPTEPYDDENGALHNENDAPLYWEKSTNGQMRSGILSFSDCSEESEDETELLSQLTLPQCLDNMTLLSGSFVEGNGYNDLVHSFLVEKELRKRCSSRDLTFRERGCKSEIEQNPTESLMSPREIRPLESRSASKLRLKVVFAGQATPIAVRARKEAREFYRRQTLSHAPVVQPHSAISRRVTTYATGCPSSEVAAERRPDGAMPQGQSRGDLTSDIDFSPVSVAPAEEIGDEILRVLIARHSSSVRFLLAPDLCTSYTFFSAFKKACRRIQVWDLPCWRSLYASLAPASEPGVPSEESDLERFSTLSP